MSRDEFAAASLYFCPTCASTAHGPDEKCALEGKCRWCKVRPATLHFGDMLSFTHGAVENCCALCAAEMQLAHAQERAAVIPELEAEVTRLRKEIAALTCTYCGLLDWTVRKYGRVTHKQACPHRTDPWHQGDPKASAAQGRGGTQGSPDVQVSGTETSSAATASPRLRHIMRWFVWQAKFIGHAVMQREFEDERVQRLVRQHFKEFHRGT